MHPDSNAGGAEIMVVDDHPSNILLLQEMLKLKGHRVRPFTRGRAAFEAAQADPPDLVLLDINMPEMDGYQTCKLFKQDPALAEVPVIFLSALSHTSGKVEAFRAGGVDYITKPFEFEEVHARVATHLKLHTLQRRLRDQNLHLDTMVQARTQELAQAHQQLFRLNRAKSDFLHMISHELRTPLNGLCGAAELILSEIPPGSDTADLVEILSDSQRRILSLVDSALLLTQIELFEGGKFEAESVSLREALASAAELAAPLVAERRVSVEIPYQPIGWTAGNRDLLVRACQGLIETAVRFAAPGDLVTVSARELTRSTLLMMDAPTGHIPASALPCFFDLFGVNEASTAAGDLGLEPAIASRILSLFGGSVSVENIEPSGIRITADCPRVVESLTASAV